MLLAWNAPHLLFPVCGHENQEFPARCSSQLLEGKVSRYLPELYDPVKCLSRGYFYIYLLLRYTRDMQRKLSFYRFCSRVLKGNDKLRDDAFLVLLDR